jgi:hypothetical protein
LHRIRGTLLGCGLPGLAADAGSLEYAASGTPASGGLDAFEAGLEAFIAG